MATYDFSSYTTLELTEDLKAAKERLRKHLLVGVVTSGSGVGQSFQMKEVEVKELKEYIAALSARLGYASETGGGTKVRPNFTCRG